MNYPEIINQWLSREEGNIVRYMLLEAAQRVKTNSAYDRNLRELSEMPLCFVSHVIDAPNTFIVSSGVVRLNASRGVNHYFFRTPSRNIETSYIADISAGQFFPRDTLNILEYRPGDRIAEMKSLAPEHLIFGDKVTILHGWGDELHEKLGLRYIAYN